MRFRGENTITPRTFINSVPVSAAGAAVASSAESYAQIMGANERVNSAVAGLTGWGRAHLSVLANNKGTAAWRTAAMWTPRCSSRTLAQLPRPRKSPECGYLWGPLIQEKAHSHIKGNDGDSDFASRSDGCWGNLEA